MTEKVHGSDKPNKLPGDQTLFGKGIPSFQEGMPPMGIILPGLTGKPPEGWQLPIADVSWVKNKFLDLPYASLSDSQKLDIYLPDSGDGPFPVVVNIHGGGFEIGDKRDIHVLPFLKGIELGYAVVSINYRLSGEAIFPAAVQDVKAAIRWIRANQTRFHLDGNRIAACGGSAGGNLAALLGVTGNTKAFDDPELGNIEFSSNVQAVVDWFGPMNFLTMEQERHENGLGLDEHKMPGSPESRYLGAPIETIPEIVKNADPTTYIHGGIPPFFVQHGKTDHLVPVQQSISFVKALETVLGDSKVYFEIIENADHGDPLFETDQNLEKLFSFLDKHLKKR